MIQLFSAEIIIIKANFLVLTANIILIKTNPTFQLLAEVLFWGQEDFGKKSKCRVKF